MAFRNLPSVFPTFLLPSVPFRRRTSSQDSASSTLSARSMVSSGSSAPPGEYLSGSKSHLRCARCATDLCLTTQIISKGFTGRYGRAYLVSPSVPYSYSYHSGLPPLFPSTPKEKTTLPNTHLHKPVPRQLVTGAHVVSDISCAFCGSVLGWKYVGADEESQRYKVGKFILETKRVRSTVCWENDADEPDFPDVQDPTRRRRSSVSNDMPFAMDEHDFTMPPDRLDKIEDVEFDSQDEDECDDLFAGVWSPHLASKRRKSKMFGRG